MSSRGCQRSRAKATLPAISRKSGSFRCWTPEEEYMLAKRWREHEDPEAAHRLVTSHLRLVAKIAMGYRGYGLPFRTDLGRQCRHDAGGEALRSRPRLPPGHLCDVVDPRRDPGIHPALLVPGEDGHHGGPEEAVLQPAQGSRARSRPSRKATSRPKTSPRSPTKLDVPEDEVVSMNRRLAAPTTRSTRRCAPTARANGRTGWSTTRATRRPHWPSARKWASAQALADRRWAN